MYMGVRQAYIGRHMDYIYNRHQLYIYIQALAYIGMRHKATETIYHVCYVG